ncbi:MAG: biotin/lipoate A/B protein ligase family protein [Gemmataceae bacterium]
MAGESPALRLLPLEKNPAPMAMALDEVLLENAAGGKPGLRFYQWARPTVSLGYFQPFSAAAGFRDLPVVRRPTGGNLLVHHHELTYALALPDRLVPTRAEELACLVHRVIAGWLNRQGVPTACQPTKGKLRVAEAPEGILCFLHPAAGDVLAGGFKVVGSAQRRRLGGLLQHGSILLKAREHAPWLKGIQDVCGAKLEVETLARELGDEIPRALKLKHGLVDWSEDEISRAARLVHGRYESADWNQRR